MARPASLSRDRIVECAATLVAEHGAEALSARRLGEALGCDPSALYRHFADMGELQREVGDHFLAAVRVDARAGETWDAAVRRICIELRTVQLRQPRLAALVRAAPTRLTNELRITEALLRELRRGGFEPAAAASAYHALIELTVGSAAIDAELAAEPAGMRSSHVQRLASSLRRRSTRPSSPTRWPSPARCTKAPPTTASSPPSTPSSPASASRHRELGSDLVL